MTPLIQVFEMERSIHFYCSLLGFKIKQRSNGWAWLERGDIDLMLNTAYDPDAQPERPDARRVAAHKDTILFFGCPDVDEAYEHLRSHGEVKKPRVAPYGMKQLFFKDPDGFGLCLQWRAS